MEKSHLKNLWNIALCPILKSGLQIAVVFFAVTGITYAFMHVSLFMIPSSVEGALSILLENIPNEGMAQYGINIFESYKHSLQVFFFSFAKSFLICGLLIWSVGSITRILKSAFILKSDENRLAAEIVQEEMRDESKIVNILLCYALLLAVVFIGWVFFKSELDYLQSATYAVWVFVVISLLVLSLKRILYLKKYQSKVSVHNKFLLITGAVEAINVAFLGLILVSYIGFLKGDIERNLLASGEIVVNQATVLAHEYLGEESRIIANENANRLAGILYNQRIHDWLESAIGTFQWHSRRMVALLWYFSIASFYFPLRYKHPMAGFFVVAAMLIVSSLGSRMFFMHVLELNIDLYGDMFFVALGGVSIGLYTSILLEPLRVGAGKNKE